MTEQTNVSSEEPSPAVPVTTKPTEETKDTIDTTIAKPVEDVSVTSEATETSAVIPTEAAATEIISSPTTAEKIEVESDSKKESEVNDREVAITTTEPEVVEELYEDGGEISLKSGSIFTKSIKAQYVAFGTDEPIALEKLSLYYKKHIKPIKSSHPPLASSSSSTSVSKTTTTTTTDDKGTTTTEVITTTVKSDDGDAAAAADKIVVDNESKQSTTEAPKKSEEKEPAETTAQPSKKLESNKALYNNIAHASVTGKGLLVYYKSKTDKDPLGVINLRHSEITESHSNSQTFTIKTRVRDYQFTASTHADKVKWENSIKKKIAEAKSLEPIEDQEKFKTVYQKLDDSTVGFAGLINVTSDSEILSEEEEITTKTPVSEKRKTLGFLNLSFIPNTSNFLTRKNTSENTTTEVTETVNTTPDAAEGTATVDKAEEKTEENVDDTAKDSKDSFIKTFLKKTVTTVTSTLTPAETTTGEATTGESSSADKKEEEKVEEKKVEDKDKKPVVNTSSENEDKTDSSPSPTSPSPGPIVEIKKYIISRSKTLLHKGKKPDSSDTKDSTATETPDTAAVKTNEETNDATVTTDKKKEETIAEETVAKTGEDSSATPETPAASTTTTLAKSILSYFKSDDKDKAAKSASETANVTDGGNVTTTPRQASTTEDKPDDKLLQSLIEDSKKHNEFFKLTQYSRQYNKQDFFLKNDGTLSYLSNKKEKKIELTNANIKKYGDKSEEKSVEKSEPDTKEKSEEKEKSEKVVEKVERYYLEIEAKSRTYKFYTENKKVRDEWYEALKEAIPAKDQQAGSTTKELLPTIAQSGPEFAIDVEAATSNSKVEKESSQEKGATKTDEDNTVPAKVETDVISSEPKSEPKTDSEPKIDTTSSDTPTS